MKEIWVAEVGVSINNFVAWEYFAIFCMWRIRTLLRNSILLPWRVKCENQLVRGLRARGKAEGKQTHELIYARHFSGLVRYFSDRKTEKKKSDRSAKRTFRTWSLKNIFENVRTTIRKSIRTKHREKSKQSTQHRILRIKVKRKRNKVEKLLESRSQKIQ